jgi:hypothetical protein
MQKAGPPAAVRLRHQRYPIGDWQEKDKQLTTA